MLKKAITYTNPFTEEPVTETHYFHLSKTTILEMEMEELHNVHTSPDGTEHTGIEAKFQRIVDAEDGKAIMVELRDFLKRSYGVKDGDQFINTKKVQEDFSHTAAFEQMLWEICTQAGAAADFTAGIMPGNLEQIAAEVRAIAEAEEAKEQGETRAPNRAERRSTKKKPAVKKKPAPEKSAIEAVEDLAKDTGTKTWTEEREEQIAAATPDNPVEINTDDIAEMSSKDLAAGLSDGRYKLS